ncbi:tail fiber domain-containing protein [Shewanella sp. SP1S1-7]|uniref:tail fiber domain-containing protein n=1 Tax=Shewanella sp. SP1S1-7 TaxID=3063536 RepID=UPI002891F851|nr:tail fiber domain-containing protein [Shewanella sp. SP1S1-7]MDT3336887.1 tail fiber domain-containing protein [Shewanella sp. SP1S1-7]
MNMQLKYLLAVIPLALSTTANADVVHADDVIIQNSACIGFDCVNNESFGFDTLRLKENNLRIKFDDTSSTGSFPSNDWQLTANDSNSGGANKFSIEDITGGRVPFTVLAGAPTNAMYINSNGNVGLGTNSPVLDLHLINGNTPAIRLEQDGSSGFSAQTWDIGSNEANFFIRDVTGGSKLPFKIVPGAPNNSLYINASGNVGIGTASPSGKLVVASGDVGFGTTSPSARLHVIDSTSANLSSSSVLVQNTNIGKNAVLLELSNPGNSYLKMTNTEASPTVAYWLVGTRQDGTFSLTNNVGGQVFIVDSAGNLTTKGTVTANNVLLTSDMNKKENFQSINGIEILSAISKLAISKWNYKSQNASEQHIGPMAQDFYQLFGLGGNDDKHISAIDSAGVSLAAIQALYDLNLKKDQQIEALSKRIADLENKTK